MKFKSLLRTAIGSVARGTPVGQALGILKDIRSSAEAILPTHLYTIIDPKRSRVITHFPRGSKYILYKSRKEATTMNEEYFAGKGEVVRVTLVPAEAHNELLDFIS